MENLRNRKEKTKLDQYSNNEKKSEKEKTPEKEAKFLRINFEIDLISVGLFLCGLLTRMYKLEEPKNIV